jgi:hypothetical protein
MKSGQMFEIAQREFDLELERLKKEKEHRNELEISEVFGRMKEQVLIATNLIGILEPDVIADVTGLSLSHIEAICGIN